MLPTRDLLQPLGHTQTQSEEMEKDIPDIGKTKEKRGRYLHEKKIDFKSKTVMRQKGHCIIMKDVSSARDYNKCKYICTQHQGI